MSRLIYIEGISSVYALKLEQAGITTTQALLKKGATGRGRKEIAELTGIPQALILQWVNKIDLHRSIKDKGFEYADLLEATGVDTITELARCNPENLYNKLIMANEKNRLVTIKPTKDQVKSWIEEAKKLPRLLQE